MIIRWNVYEDDKDTCHTNNEKQSKSVSGSQVRGRQRQPEALHWASDGVFSCILLWTVIKKGKQVQKALENF